MEVVGTSAKGEVDEHEDDGMILEHHSSKWNLEPLVAWPLSTGTETRPDMGKEIGKAEWCRIWVVVNWDGCHLHSPEKIVSEKDASYMHAMQQTNAAITCTP